MLTFNSSLAVGDESWINPNGYNSLIFRVGKVVAQIDGSTTRLGIMAGDVPSFPSAAVEAVAYQILLRASYQPALTGVSTEQARVDVNGHSLSQNGSLVAGRTYVPVAEFAKAMGLTSRWNTKTGALLLSGTGHKTVALIAGSTAATVEGAKTAVLSVPVLKQAGQPVMTLDDLLTLTGGKITGHSGDIVQVKS